MIDARPTPGPSSKTPQVRRLPQKRMAEDSNPTRRRANRLAPDGRNLPTSPSTTERGGLDPQPENRPTHIPDGGSALLLHAPTEGGGLEPQAKRCPTRFQDGADAAHQFTFHDLVRAGGTRGTGHKPPIQKQKTGRPHGRPVELACFASVMRCALSTSGPFGTKTNCWMSDCASRREYRPHRYRSQGTASTECRSCGRGGTRTRSTSWP